MFPAAPTILVLLLLSASSAKEQRIQRDSFGVPITRFDISKSRNGKVLVTDLDNVAGRIALGKRNYFRQTKVAKSLLSLLQYNWEQGKMQSPVPTGLPFPCNLTEQPVRSNQPPQTVHQLRAGDIDVIASIGDSLSAGTGVISRSIVDLINDWRSLSFANGGRGTWRNFLTLPNILRMFNPNLYGYATDDGLITDRSSAFLVATPGAMSRDMVYQARVLIKRLQRDPRVDMARHWKMLTVFTGNNDFCVDVCYFDSKARFLRQHEEDLRRTFTELRDHVPRLIINLIPSLNMVTTALRMTHVPLQCSLTHAAECPCIFKAGRTPDYLASINELTKRWWHIEKRVAALPEFRTDEFAINYRDINFDSFISDLPSGFADLRPFASDCFHISQLGQAMLANAVWNSMFQNHTLIMRPFESFACPTPERPYLMTWANKDDLS